MSMLAVVEGDPEGLVPDVCRELAARLPWCVFGETVVPDHALPTGTLRRFEAAGVAGAVVVSIDPNQAAPEYCDGSAEPGLSPVRLVMDQTITRSLDDLDVLVERRRDLRRVLHDLTGRIGG